MINEKKSEGELLKLAKEARARSYAPYSGITVGAALLTKSGKVYVGANIENAAFSPTICAERVAIFKAVSEGERDFTKIAIAGGRHGEKSTDKFAPCGVCRQVMREFCDLDFEIILEHEGGEIAYTLGELLPESFEKSKL